MGVREGEQRVVVAARLGRERERETTRDDVPVRWRMRRRKRVKLAEPIVAKAVVGATWSAVLLPPPHSAWSCTPPAAPTTLRLSRALSWQFASTSRHGALGITVRPCGDDMVTIAESRSRRFLVGRVVAVWPRSNRLDARLSSPNHHLADTTSLPQSPPSARPSERFGDSRVTL